MKLALAYAVLAAMLVCAAALALAVGHGGLGDPMLRAARVLAALLAGAGLAGGGVVVQGVFRNPLVSPSILGTTAGASLGGQVALLALATQAADSLLPAELVLPLG